MSKCVRIIANDFNCYHANLLEKMTIYFAATKEYLFVFEREYFNSYSFITHAVLTIAISHCCSNDDRH